VLCITKPEYAYKRMLFEGYIFTSIGKTFILPHRYTYRHSRVERDNASTGSIQDRIRVGIDAPAKPVRRDVLHFSINAKVMLAIDVEAVQRNENLGFLPKFDVVVVVCEGNVTSRLELRLIGSSDVLCINGFAEDVHAIFGIGDPAYLGGVEDGIAPCFDVKCESIYVDVGSECLETTMFGLVHVDVVQEDDDLWRGKEGPFKFDSRGRWVIGIDERVPHMLSGQEIQIGRSEGHDIQDAVKDSRIAPSGDVTVGPLGGEVLKDRLDANIGVVADI